MKHLPEFINKILHLLSICNSPKQLHQIQTQIIVHNLHPNSTITSSFITASQSLGLLNTSLLLFNQIQRPHVYICNTLIRAFSHSSSPQASLSIYTHMLRDSISPNNYTFPFVLKSLSDRKHLRQGQSVHTHVVKLGHEDDIYVQNSILNLYSSCGEIDTCQKVFDGMSMRDVVSWTVLIEGYRNAGKLDDALVTFEQMQFSGVPPNRVTMVNALSACASSRMFEMGVWIHDFVRRNGWEVDVILGTCLVDMYGKCGRSEMGVEVFQSMRDRSVFTWNALIKGLALAKNGEEAVKWFYRMEEEGFKPDEVTVLGVMSACSHSGLVDTGREIFHSMINAKYGFMPNVKHYGCIIDLLARAGCLDEAFKMIESMPFEPTKVMWGALVAGCRAHGALELSELAARKLVELEPDNVAYYVLLSNLYAEMGRWVDVENVRRLMKEKRLHKDLGSSSIELDVEQHNTQQYNGLLTA